MRNIMLCLVFVMAANFCLSEQAFAGGGKAGGKKQSRIEMTNQNPASGRTISIWVVPAGTKLPTTVGEARKLRPLRNLQAQETESFNVATGNHIVVAADNLVFQGAADSTPINSQLVTIRNPVVVGTTTVKLTTKTVGPAPKYLPEIKP